MITVKYHKWLLLLILCFVCLCPLLAQTTTSNPSGTNCQEPVQSGYGTPGYDPNLGWAPGTTIQVSINTGGMTTDQVNAITQVLVELTETLARPKFKKNIAASLFSPAELVDLYVGLAALVHPVPVPRLAPDPDDDVVIGTALAASAELIVTGDRTLLAVERYEGGRIVSVSEARDLVLAR